MRVLEVGAAKCWGAQHLVPRGVATSATDILADPVIGLGRGDFYERASGRSTRVQADGEHLPFATRRSTSSTASRRLHHALDLAAMVREMARVAGAAASSRR